MNFFKAQKKAKKSTFLLVVLFTIGLLLISLLISLLLMLILLYEKYNINTDLMTLFLTNMPFFLMKVLPIVFGIIIIGSLYKLYELRSYGGSHIAQSLNGILIQSNTKDFNEKQLLNIVQEMSIASGIIVPPIYLIKDDSINAFAAGFSLDDIVIGITSGSINKLNRDELQGVIAHEFSHIFNGDMKLNMNLSGALHGLLFLREFGRIILDSSSNLSYSSRDKDGRGQAMLIGAVFVVFGYLGYFFGQIIKALVNRQREYLADATAVQYTRNIFGISNALKKIGGDNIFQNNDLSNSANMYSHMFFSNISQLFSTHPPLENRIKRIDKNWNEEYIVNLSNTNEINKSYNENIRNDESMKMNVFAILGAIDSIGIINEQTVSLAKNDISMIPKEIRKEIDSSFGALCVILALIVNKNSKLASNDFDLIQKVYGVKTVSNIRQIWLSAKKMNQQQILVSVELLMSKLMQLSKKQYLTLKSTFDKIIKNDGKITYFEWLIEKLLINKLDIHFKLKNIVKVKYKNINSVKNEIEILLSIFVSIEKDNDEVSKSLFIIAASFCNLKNANYINKNEYKFDKLDIAIEKIRHSDTLILQNILLGLVEAYKIDDYVSINEYYLLKVLSIYFNLPLPIIKL